jgi:non-homologous end joining protein Ku
LEREKFFVRLSGMHVDEVSFDLELELEILSFGPLWGAGQKVRKIYLEKGYYLHV